MNKLLQFVGLLAIFLLLSLSSITVVSANNTPATGWLIDANHPAVSVSMQLTGQQDPALKTVNVLLQVNLQEGWKTYWRSPGEGGTAPQFNWSASTNVKDVKWSWPAPKRYPVLGVDTLGYKNQVQFPITLVLNDMRQKTNLQGTLTLASCTNICVLSDYEIDLSFDPSSLQTDANAVFEYAQAVGSVPVLLDEKQLAKKPNKAPIIALGSAWTPLTQQLTVQVTGLLDWSDPDMFIDSNDPQLEDVYFSKPKISVSGKQLTATFKASSWAGNVDLLNKKIHSTIIDKNINVELVSTAADKILVGENSKNLFSIFLISLLGGLILNIMPCVLPVLGMKLSSILTAHGIEQSQIRKQFLASSVGILSSFWLLAAFLLSLKLSGQALGWGIQFQSPYFIVFMIVITGLFAANMLGLFEIQLSSRTQTWLATRGDQSLLGYYLQGMFATLLATPCSAPFLGTAVAFALAASPLGLFAIFTALGLGMAIPWLLIAAFPRLALLLPKPGKWMNTVKLIFALMILAACFWLLNLLASFIGTAYMLLATSLFVLVLFTLVVRKYGKRLFFLLLLLLLLTSSVGFVIGHLTDKYWVTSSVDDLTWQVLDASAIAENVASGKTLFIDVTADWCVTCKANKLAVLSQNPVYSALKAKNVLLMKGDWTVRSDTVTEYLQSFNRYGVPFNIVYGPAAPQGIPLPTILSSEDVLSAIRQAQAGK